MPIAVHVQISKRLLGTRGGLYGQMQQLGIRIQNRARRNCPVRTGRLRSSITSSSPFAEGNSLKISVGSNVKYARFVEQGTRFMVARPYLRPALEQEVK